MDMYSGYFVWLIVTALSICLNSDKNTLLYDHGPVANI